jgi:hypothetical protein
LLYFVLFRCRITSGFSQRHLHRNLRGLVSAVLHSCLIIPRHASARQEIEKWWKFRRKKIKQPLLLSIFRIEPHLRDHIQYNGAMK